MEVIKIMVKFNKLLISSFVAFGFFGNISFAQTNQNKQIINLTVSSTPLTTASPSTGSFTDPLITITPYASASSSPSFSPSPLTTVSPTSGINSTMVTPEPDQN